MINAAIAGLGRWGRRLVDSVQENGRAKSDAIVFRRATTRTPERARDYAQSQNLAIACAFDDILHDPAIDAVVLATPHDQDVPQIVAATKARKHVFVEKPLALTRADAELAVAAARAADVVLAVGHNRRFLPATQTTKTLVTSGGLGTILHIEGNFSGNFGMAYRPENWRSKEAGAAGAMTAMGIHVIDMFVHLAGPIEHVAATGIRRAVAVDMDDAVSVKLNFRSGASGYLSTLLATPRQWRVQVFGTAGWAHIRDHHLLDICMDDAVPRLSTFEPVDELRLELEAFAAAIGGTSSYPVEPEEVTHGIAVLEATIKSAADGGAVTRV